MRNVKVIKLSQVTKQFENTELAFKDRVFEKQTSYIILGPSGCGKTTLLNLIGGSISVSNGHLEVETPNNTYALETLSGTQLAAYRKNHISYVSQEFNLLDKLTVYDNLQLVKELHKSTQTIASILEQVGLSGKEKRRVRTLSGGEKQRVCIARALLQGGNLLLCDEPTGALNQALAESIIKLLIQVHKQSKGVLIVVTHDERLVPYFDVKISYKDLMQTEGVTAHV